MRGRNHDATVELQHALEEARARIAKLEAERHDRSQHDPCTQVLTLDAFRAGVQRELDRARRSAQPLTLLMVDIDDFRALNALHGSAAGDDALRAIAQLVTATVRSTDVVGRTGADEVSVLLVDTDVQGGLDCGQRVIAALELTDAGPSVSVGVAAAAHGATVEGLLAAAANAVDRSRAAGGGRVHATGSVPVEAHSDVIEALATALLERDRYTGEHSESVVAMARAVARGLGLDSREIEHIGAAALLHDIGKVAIPDDILHKPAALDDAEWALMREHPVIGERILRAVPGMGAVARIVRHEHERFDGGGYPDGLRGEEIPIGSRIILACDTYHAMTSDRPYRASMPHTDAIHELLRCSGTQFDPRVTEALVAHLYAARQLGT